LLTEASIATMVGVLTSLVCIECLTESNEQAKRWRAYLVDGHDGDDQVVVYCPACAQRKFGPLTPKLGEPAS
jgi:hypothetical protein